ncbi:MAG TPA: protein phosphatase 2C domain-containing protein [Ktedonobacteraceae bacterium]|nr:protein phosphatase 2C domain-containing protein [Ktedonobacteraceae bacterium]
MLEEFKTLYDIHNWLRYITWVGLASATLFLLWASGGFPPQSWLLLIEAIPQIPGWWSTDGAATLFPLFVLLALSITWAMGWYALGWVVLALMRHHRRLSQLKQQQDDLVKTALDWEASHNFALAAVLPQGHATMKEALQVSAPTISVPMMRLPQKQILSQTAQVSTFVPAKRPTPSDIPDIPTRPDALRSRTTYVTEARLSASNSMMSPIVSQAVPRVVQQLEVGVGWHTGLERRGDPNEDGLVVLQGTCTYHGRLVPFGLFVVADGMGGHDCGQEASRIAVQCMMHTVLQNIIMGNELTEEYLTDIMVGGVQWANSAICQYGDEQGKDMGTTLTAALVLDMKAYIVNVGDSRTYLYREGKGLSQVTRDHSLVATLVAFGEITPEQIYTHPERNKVYRCLGSNDLGENIEVDWFVADLSAYDRLLLCSDGLWEMVRDPEIGRILRSNSSPTRASDVLIQAALQGGGVDNISVIVVRVP